MQIKVSDRLTLTLSEQGFKYSNWLHINDDVRAVVETGLDREGLLGLDPERIDLVVNSHHHLDHIRGNGLFSNAQVMIHSLEADILSDEAKSYYANSLDLWDALMPGESVDEANAEINFGEEVVQPSPFATGQQLLPLEDGQLLDFGHVRAEVLHTPGHSAGHCCLWFPEEGLLYSADICLTKVGPWYGEHLADPAALMRSIDRIIALNPERVVSAHIHEVVDDPVSCLQEFKGRILKREERVYQQLRERPADIHTLADAKLIYRAHPTRFVLFWEKLMLLKHLESLQNRGLIREENGVYFRA